MCTSVNLKLHNFNSNSNKNVLEAMAIEDRPGDLNLCNKDVTIDVPEPPECLLQK